MGEISEVFADKHNVSKLTGSLAIGHTRYSTTGASSLLNIQPFIITNRSRNLAIVHNGLAVFSYPSTSFAEKGLDGLNIVWMT